MKYENVEIGFLESSFGDDGIAVAPIINGKKTNCYFYHKYEAIIYAGLVESGISANDCSHLSRYICSMLNGMKNEK